MYRLWPLLVVLAAAGFAQTLTGTGATPASAGPESHPPYFNREARQLLIEGSYRIIPSPPIAVGHERQLLMDNHVISDAWGCRRTATPRCSTA